MEKRFILNIMHGAVLTSANNEISKHPYQPIVTSIKAVRRAGIYYSLRANPLPRHIETRDDGMNRTGYFEDLVGGKRRKAGGGVRRDPNVAANWLSNNLFGLLKDRLGSTEDQDGHDGGDGEGGLER